MDGPSQPSNMKEDGIHSFLSYEMNQGLRKDAFLDTVGRGLDN